MKNEFEDFYQDYESRVFGELPVERLKSLYLAPLGVKRRVRRLFGSLRAAADIGIMYNPQGRDGRKFLIVRSLPDEKLGVRLCVLNPL